MDFPQLTPKVREEEKINYNINNNQNKKIKEYDDLKLDNKAYNLKIIYNDKTVNFRLTEKNQNCMPLLIYTNECHLIKSKFLLNSQNDKILLAKEEDYIRLYINSNKIILKKKELPINEQLKFIMDNLKQKDELILDLKNSVEESKKEIESLKNLLKEKTEEIDDIYTYLENKEKPNELKNENEKIQNILKEIIKKNYKENNDKNEPRKDLNKYIIQHDGKKIILLKKSILNNKIIGMDLKKNLFYLTKDLRQFNKVKRELNKCIIHDYNEFDEFKKSKDENLLWVEFNSKENSNRIYYYDNVIYFEKQNKFIRLNDLKEYEMKITDGCLYSKKIFHCLMNIKDFKDYYYNLDEEKIKNYSIFTPSFHLLVKKYVNMELSEKDYVNKKLSEEDYVKKKLSEEDYNLYIENHSINNFLSILFTRLHNEHKNIIEKLDVFTPFYERGINFEKNNFQDLNRYKLGKLKDIDKEIEKTIIPYFKKQMETPISKLFLFIIYFDRACKECGQECCADFTFNFIFDVELRKILNNDDLKIEDLIKSVCSDKSECPKNKNHVNYTKRLFVTLPEYLIINTSITYENATNCSFRVSNFLDFSIDRNNLYISNKSFSKKNLNTVYILDSFIFKTKIFYKSYNDNQWYYEEGNNKDIIEGLETCIFGEFPVLFIYKKNIKKNEILLLNIIM